MDQALNWLIELEGVDEQQHILFQERLGADPENARAFDRAKS
ncbi:FecR/PupR family sigma factor regulator, partial [Pseudomonas viridiflava]